MNFQLSDFGAEMVSIEQVERSNSCRGCLVGHVNLRGNHHPTKPSLGTSLRPSLRLMPSWLASVTSSAKLLWPKPAVSPTTQIAGVSRHHLDVVGAHCLLSGWWRSVARRVPVSMSTAVRSGSRRGFDSRRLHQFGPSGVESRHALTACDCDRGSRAANAWNPGPNSRFCARSRRSPSRDRVRPGSLNFCMAESPRLTWDLRRRLRHMRNSRLLHGKDQVQVLDGAQISKR